MTFQTASRAATTAPLAPSMTSRREWRCSSCSKLLGVYERDRLHIRFARGHEYLVAVPATCTCRGCGRLSELTGPSRG